MRLHYIFILQCLPLLGNTFDWVVIGAGPAGITVVAVLREQLPLASILWIDDTFNVGRMGTFYREVPGNLQTKRLITYIKGCSLFEQCKSCAKEKLFKYNPEAFHPLHIIVDPLCDITYFLKKKVIWHQGTVTSVTDKKEYWLINMRKKKFAAKKVILAIGAHPKKLHYPLQEISLDEALDKKKLSKKLVPTDRVAVFGGMHSAFLVLKYLTELGVAKIVNFYTSPYFFGKPGTAGLEGVTTHWVKTVLEKNPPPQLIRVKNTTKNINELLPSCNKVIYAIGYERNQLKINDSMQLSFDEKTGKIDRCLYGIGIAFPQTALLEEGKKVEINGLNSYLEYAKRNIPYWNKE